MMTWKLWRALQYPPVNHPLYRRTITQRPAEGLRLEEGITLRLLWRIALPLVFMTIFALTPIIVPLVVVTPVLLPVIVNWCGIQWAVKAGSTIARENELGTYDVIAMIPCGAFGASWTIGSACVHRGSSFADLHTFVGVLVRFLLVMLGIALMIAIVIGINGRTQTAGATFIALISVAALVAAFYLDYVQSALVGWLAGMLVPTYVRNPIDARLWGFVCFLLLQVTAYLVTWLIGFVVIPALYQSLSFGGLYADLSVRVLRVPVFYLVREGIIGVLWYALVQRLNAIPSDVDAIFL